MIEASCCIELAMLAKTKTALQIFEWDFLGYSCSSRRKNASDKL